MRTMTSSTPFYSESVATTTTLESPGFPEVKVTFTAGTARIVRAVPVVRPPEQKRPGASVRAEMQFSPEGRAALNAARREIGKILQADHIAPLAALRLTRGMSQSQLSTMSGLPQPQISRLENGCQGDVMLSTVRTLAAALGFSLENVAAAIEAGRQPAKPQV